MSEKKSLGIFRKSDSPWLEDEALFSNTAIQQGPSRLDTETIEQKRERNFNAFHDELLIAFNGRGQLDERKDVLYITYPAIEQLVQKAKDAGITLKHLSTKNSGFVLAEITGMGYGRTINDWFVDSIKLNKTLEDKELQTARFDTLRENDSAATGPWTVIFDLIKQEIIVLSKGRSATFYGNLGK